MYIKSCFVFLLISAFISLKDAARESIDGGFGTNINWYTSLDAGVKAAQAEYKPIMVIVHRAWCPACKKLKPALKNSQEYAALSKDFVMVNLDDETDARSTVKYEPDGGYVPRILFLDWNGELRPEFYNKWGSGKYKYYHSDANTVTSTMRSALDYLVPIANYYKEQYAYQPVQSFSNYVADL